MTPNAAKDAGCVYAPWSATCPGEHGLIPRRAIVAIFSSDMLWERLVYIGVQQKHHEVPPIVMSAVLGLLMAFVAYGRLVLVPIP